MVSRSLFEIALVGLGATINRELQQQSSCGEWWVTRNTARWRGQRTPIDNKRQGFEMLWTPGVFLQSIYVAVRYPLAFGVSP